MCAANALAIYLCFTLPMAATPPWEAPRRFDHFQPAQLNQAAAEQLRDGDDATALILLERAALLAPHEPTIAANLAELRAFRKAPLPVVLGRPAEPPARRDMVEATIGAAEREPLPALWPAK